MQKYARFSDVEYEKNIGYFRRFKTKNYQDIFTYGRKQCFYEITKVS